MLRNGAKGCRKLTVNVCARDCSRVEPPACVLMLELRAWCVLVCVSVPVSPELFWWQCVVTGSKVMSALRQRLAFSSPSIIHTPGYTDTPHPHTFKSSGLMTFSWRFLCACKFVYACLCVYLCICMRLSPRKPIAPLKSMNCSVCPGKQAEN